MTSILCKILRPACVIATLLMMAIIVAYFWGVDVFPGVIVWRLLLSYCVLLVGSFVVFYIDNPASLTGGRER